MQRSSRVSAGVRAGVSLSALAQLRAARLSGSEGGARRVDQVQLRDEGEIYSEVTEDEYAALVAERRLQGDFVENDGLDSGYADDGEENWAEYQLAEDGPSHNNSKARGGRQGPSAALPAIRASAPSLARSMADRPTPPVSAVWHCVCV